ncbi:hypothetical protein KXQ82_13690 [Mucilaginibacter sp. HMF5004]|uniref:hypothetical protein n=1 Tax=Mucilaginibacter rivuli TaxID=2857527 RepID=UPI001C5D0915|nr:hypothetical protein [Mucilaginibacter rivuli]MBW4890778.1 hypothetical protein [Mucilaginibacter rivuli]
MKAVNKTPQTQVNLNLEEMPKAAEAETHVRVATLYTLHSNFIGIDHRRKTGRMVGHEPGPDHIF